MTGAEWKRRAQAEAEELAQDLELPSGMIIRARRPGPLQYTAWSRLPLMLANTSTPDCGPSGAAEISAFLRELLVYCCLSPRIAEQPKGDDEVSPRDIPEADWQYIVTWAMRVEEAAKLRPFRVERKDGGDHRDGENILVQTIGPVGDRGQGAGAGGGPGSVPAGD
jgi:hypothetical protein